MQWPTGEGAPVRGACVPLLVAGMLLAAPAQAGQAAASGRSVSAIADAAVSRAHPRAHYGRRPWLRVGGSARWRSYVRFRVGAISGAVRRAVLVLRASRAPRTALDVRVALGHRWREGRITADAAPRVGARVARLRAAGHPGRRGSAGGRTMIVDVTQAVRSAGTFDFVLTARCRHSMRIASREARRGAPRLVVRTGTAPPSAGGSVPPQTPARPPGAVVGIWTSARELASRPTSGPAWQALKTAADGPVGQANISDQDSDDDVNTLAAALVYARTGGDTYRAKAAAAIAAAIGTEQGGRTLALGRNLASYVIAADLIDLGSYDSGLDARFRSWLSAVRTESLDGETLIQTHETRPNNWGTMAGASRAAADAYLGDASDLDRAATVFRGYLGDRGAYAGFSFGDLSWQADPAQPVGVVPAGAVKAGLPIDGALPDDMRRGCPFTIPPCPTNYAWEGLQGVVVQAEILSRRGYDAFGWQDRAVLRAVEFLDLIDGLYGGWWAASDDEWQPWVINSAYGAHFPAISPAGAGKVMGWTDWVFGG
jgi:Alginate lyase